MAGAVTARPQDPVPLSLRRIARPELEQHCDSYVMSESEAVTVIQVQSFASVLELALSRSPSDGVRLPGSDRVCAAAAGQAARTLPVGRPAVPRASDSGWSLVTGGQRPRAARAG